MHVHLPKPLHGWREFFGEVGIIVQGVLVALALESIAEELRWSRKVSDARQVIRYEIGHNMRLMEWQQQQAACVDRRLDELGAALKVAIARGRLPPVGAFYGPDAGTYPDGVWQSQIAAQTATHFSANELASLARVYRYVGLLRDQGTSATQAWVTLRAMSGPGRPVDAATIDRVATALIVARAWNRSPVRSHDLIVRILKQSSLGLGFPQVDPENPPVLPSGTPPVCQPISSDVPHTYGG